MTTAPAVSSGPSTSTSTSTSTTAVLPAPRRGTFTVLRVRSFRIYLGGQSFAMTGTWMQSIAQDWLVLQLTGRASAVGLTMALQFLPMLLLGMHGGMIADRCRKRRVLIVTQSLNGLLAGVLAISTLTGVVAVQEVYLLTLLSGLVFVVDNPTRQVFVTEVVPAHLLRSAVALNAATFQTTRLVGPAVAGVLIGTVGCGWAFAVNALCYAGPLIGLARLRHLDRLPRPVAGGPVGSRPHGPGQLRAAARYVRERPHIAWTIALVGVVGTFGLNFPVVLTGMARTTFGGGADLYGVFNVVLAVGSVAGALLVARGAPTRMRLIVAAGAGFGLTQLAAALAPGLVLFLLALVGMGLTNLAFQAMASSAVQLWVEPAMRGRVMGLYMIAFTGGTPLGGPLVGAITELAGPRVGMAVCGLLPALAAFALALRLSPARRPARRPAAAPAAAR